MTFYRSTTTAELAILVVGVIACCCIGAEHHANNTTTIKPLFWPPGPYLRGLQKPENGVKQNCFSARNTVEVKNKGIIAMSELQVGDLVKTADGTMERVHAFGPFQPDTKAEFLQIHAQGRSTPLEISKGHLLFVNGGKAIPAAMVQVGDKLDAGRSAVVSDSVKVVKIKQVVRTGIYTPFTKSGTIIVSGFAASSYVTAQDDNPATEGAWVVLGEYVTPFSMQWVAHVFHALPRMVVRSSQCHTYSPDNDQDSRLMTGWVKGTKAVGSWLKQQDTVVSIAVFVPLFMIGLAVYLLEAFLFGNIITIWAVAAGALAATSAGWSGRRKATKVE